MLSSRNISAFQLKHSFAVAGFICTAIAIVLLTVFYRDMMIKEVIIQGERQNQLLAQTALNSVKTELLNYLHTVNAMGKFDPNKVAVPARLKQVVEHTLSNNYVSRIKIYRRDGVVVYTSLNDKVRDDEDDDGFVSAVSGKVSSKLEFDDIFHFFNSHARVENLVESYLPVREQQDSPILGVFEIYTDVSEIVGEVRHTEIVIMLGVVIILFLLYGFLMMVVSRTSNTISRQQAVIHERTRMLELLSSQLIHAQEDEKKNLARDLHENIVQTLAGVKNVIASVLSNKTHGNVENDSQLRQSISVLQDSIGEIRTLAMELRPPSLDDFGLIKTLEWLCRQYQLWYPNISLHTDFHLDERNLSDAIKTIIYRVAQEAMDSITKQTDEHQIKLDLHEVKGRICLTIDACTSRPDDNKADASGDSGHNPLYAMQNRTMLSGGEFAFENLTGSGCVRATASWSVV